MSKLREGDIAIFNTDSGGNIQAIDDSATITRETQIDRGDCESITSPMITGETTPILTNATWVRQGKIAVFDGTARVVLSGGGPNIGTGDISIVIRMKSFDTVPLNFGMLFSKFQDGPNNIELGSFGIQNRLQLNISKSATSISGQFSASTNPFDTNEHHLVLVINRTTDKALMYMDKIKDATELDLSTLPADISNTGNMSFGARDTGTVPYEGDLSVAIYDGIALNQTQINTLFDGTPLDISTLNLASWHPFDEDALDNSGNGHHGTPTNITYTEGPEAARISFEDSFSYKFTKTNTAGTLARVSLTDNESTSDMHGLTAGFTYRFSAYEFAATIGIDFADVQIGIAEFYDSIWHFTLIDADTADAWDNSKVTVEINEATTGAYIFFQAKSTADQYEYFYIDEISLFRLDDKFSRNIEPVMDGGFESAVYITLFGNNGDNLWMNEYLTEDEKIESSFMGFMEASPITLSNINRAQELALSDLKWFINVTIADTITVVIDAITKNRVDITVIILANGEELFKNTFQVNWGFQENDPATGRIV